MATTSPFIGRREGIGIGVETTPGTPVAPSAAGWMRWLDQDLTNKVDVITNESAMGVVAQVSDSEIVAQYAQGKLGGKVTSTVVGYLLSGFFGFPVTTGSNPYTHTFSMTNSSQPAPALTLSVVRPIDSFRYAYGVIDSLEFSVEQGGWLMVDAAVKARVGASASDTVALATETEFTSKHVVAKIAASTAGLGAAPALSAIKATVTLERDSNSFAPLGTDSLVEFDRKQFTAKGEITIRHTDTQYNTDFLANTAKAFSLTAINGAQSLAFVASKVRYRELARSTDKDDIVTQVISFECELDTAAGYQLIQPVLVNAKTNYTS